MRFSALVLSSLLLSFSFAGAQTSFTAPALDAQTVSGGSHTARPRLANQATDAGALVTLPGHVRPGLTAQSNAGPVEDSTPITLTFVLKRSAQQQQEMEALIQNQQRPGSPDYHKWLTPAEFGERFGVAEADVKQLTNWLESQGMQVKSVLNNASMIRVETSAAGVRNTFGTQLNYWNIGGRKLIANAQEPRIPAAFVPVIAGIKGLYAVTPRPTHTAVQHVAYDQAAHKWHSASTSTPTGARPDDVALGGSYELESPQDLYTIYNVNPVFNKGNRGAGSVIGIVEPSDMDYGTVDSNGQASGGNVATFRSIFGITTPLNMVVMHGAGSVTCADPGTVNGYEEEAAIDAEWSGAVAPAAKLLFMSCPYTGTADGLMDAETALVDNNLSDVITVSFSLSELNASASAYSLLDQLYSQAATQGQTFVVASGDSGSDDSDQNTSGTAVNGLNVNYLASSPLVTAVGGTDFSDYFDQIVAGIPESKYWGSTNSAFYGNALSYIPEMTWSNSCADSMAARASPFSTPAANCAMGANAQPPVDGSVIGGGGGFSVHYAQPSYQARVPGLNTAATMRAMPDVSLFAASGYFTHFLVLCSVGAPCTSTSTIGGAGGTSFAAPQVAGVTALLVTQTGARVGGLNSQLYSLAKNQFTASATASACYSNGQTVNNGVTVALPAASCIFNDVTTGNNDVPCAAGAKNCFVNSGAQYGLLSLNGATSLSIAYPAGAGYDEATGLGSLNIANLVSAWNQTPPMTPTTTSLSANPSTITSAQSTTLTATVSQAAKSTTYPTGAVSFSASMNVQTCTLANGTCSVTVAGSVLSVGGNSINATYSGDSQFAGSTSANINVSVTKATTCLPASAGVSICSPAAGTGNASSSPVTITAGALAASGNITAIRAYIDNTAVFTTNNPTAAKSQQVSQAVTVAAGSHKLVVVGYQSTGGSVTGTESFTVGVSTACYPSSAGAEICSPAQNATTSSPVTVVAGGTAGSGTITAIRIYVDGVAKTLINNPQKSKSFAINTPVTIAAGKHSIVVVCYQSTGGSVTASDSVTIQ